MSIVGADFSMHETLIVYLMPMDDEPSVTLFNASFTLNSTEASSLSLRSIGLSIDDPDGDGLVQRNLLTFSLTSTCGYMDLDEALLVNLLPSPPMIRYEVPHYANSAEALVQFIDGYSFMIMTGSAYQLTVAVTAISLYPFTFMNGSCAIDLNLTKVIGGGTYSESISVLGSVFNVPFLKITSVPQIKAAEGAVVSGASLNISIIDTGLRSDKIYNLNISATLRGNLDMFLPTLAMKNGFDSSIVMTTPFSKNYVLLSGRRSALEKASHFFTMNPAPYFHGSITLRVAIFDDIMASAAESEIVFYPVNNPPSFTILASELPQQVGSDLSSLISINDPDIDFLKQSNSQLYRSHSSECCFLSVNITCNGCQLAVAAQRSSTVIMVGTSDDIKTNMGSVQVWMPDEMQDSFIEISVDDLQSYGAGGHFLLMETVHLNTTKSYLPPSLDCPLQFKVVEKKATFKIIELASHRVSLRNVRGNFVTLNVKSTNGGKLGLPSLNQDISQGSLNITATPPAVNNYINEILYMEAPLGSKDTIVFTLIDREGDVLGSCTVPVFKRYLQRNLSLEVMQSVLQYPQGSNASFSSFLGDNQVEASLFPYDDGGEYNALVSYHLEGGLCIQSISVILPDTSIEQVIFFQAPFNDTIKAGNFSFFLDLSMFGLTDSISGLIDVNIPASRWNFGDIISPDEISEVDWSLERVLTSMLAPLSPAFNIKVLVQKYSILNSSGFRLTFRHAPYNFPLLEIASCGVYSAKGTVACIPPSYYSLKDFVRDAL